MTQHQLNSKNNGSFLRPYIRHENRFLSSVAKDGNDGHGLNLEKIGEVLMLRLQKSPKNSNNYTCSNMVCRS